MLYIFCIGFMMSSRYHQIRNGGMGVGEDNHRLSSRENKNEQNEICLKYSNKTNNNNTVIIHLPIFYFSLAYSNN